MTHALTHMAQHEHCEWTRVRSRVLAMLQESALLLLGHPRLGHPRLAQLMTHGFRHATLFKVHLRPLSLCWLLLHLWNSAGHTAYENKPGFKYTRQFSAFHRWQPLAQELVLVCTAQSKATASGLLQTCTCSTDAYMTSLSESCIAS